MFYYYGRKKQIAKHYYIPSNITTIVEPFAGSAAFSLHGDNWKKQVILIEKDPKIVEVWRYLQNSTVEQIQALPDLVPGDLLQSFNLTQVERLLISMHMNPGSTTIKNKVMKFSRWAPGKAYIIANLHKIKHWDIRLGDYSSAPLIAGALYFIDPPYRVAGAHYAYNNKLLDYNALAKWAYSLPGHVIACEGNGHESYLPFKQLTMVNRGGMNGGASAEWVFYK